MLAFHPGASASDTNVLARKTSANEIDGNSIGSESCGREFSNVFILPHVGPMLRQNLSAERVDLAERDSLEPARALES
jgi:hypothetical protein